MASRHLVFLVSVLLILTNRAVPEGTSHERGTMLQPDEIKWGPGPPKLPPGAKFVVLDGDPSKPGASYTLRAKLPDGYSVPPHWHPMDEHVTVIQGTMMLGMGERFGTEQLRELPAGSYARLPKREAHFNVYEGETIIQLHGIGPYDIHYVDPADDPSRKIERR